MAMLRKALLGALFLLPLAAAPAGADEYSIEPQLQTSVVANDNIKLSTGEKTEAVGGILSPQVRFGFQDSTTDLSLTTRADFNGYVVNSDLSSIDNRVTFHGGYRTERSYLALDADYNRDTIFENVEDTDVEFVDKARVETITVNPSYTYELSPRDQLGLEAGYLDRSYSGDENSLTDYQYYTGGIDWTHDLTEIDELSVGVNYGHFDPEGSEDQQADIVDLQLGWAHEFTQRLRTRIAAGPSYIAYEDSKDDIGYNVDARLTYDLDTRTVVSLNYTLRTEPSSRGEVTENRSRLGFTASHDISEDVTLRLASNFVGKETGSSSDTSSFSVQPSVIWHVSREVDLSLSYQYRYKDTDSPDDNASSNAGMLTLVYRPDRMTWSD